MNMTLKILGIIAIIVGITMVAYSGFSFVTNEEVVNVGPLSVNRAKEHQLNWSPIIGLFVLAGGILTILFAGRVKK